MRHEFGRLWLVFACLMASRGAATGDVKQSDVGFLEYTAPDNHCRVHINRMPSFDKWSGNEPSPNEVARAMAAIRLAGRLGNDYASCRADIVAKKETQRESSICVRDAMAEIDYGALWMAIHLAGASRSLDVAKLLHESYVEYDGFNSYPFELMVAFSWKHIVIDPLSASGKVRWLVSNWDHGLENGHGSIEELASDMLFEELQCSLGARQTLERIVAGASPAIRIKALRHSIEDTHQRYSLGRLSEETIPVIMRVAVHDNDPKVRQQALSELKNIDMAGSSWLRDLDRIVKSPTVSIRRKAALLASLGARKINKVICGKLGCGIERK